MIGRNEVCWCGSGKKWKHCHAPMKEPSLPSNERLKEEYFRDYQIIIKTAEQIQGIRAASHLAAKILDVTAQFVKEGVTTLEINDFSHQLHLDAGAIPAPLNYGHPPFPKSICTSVNEVICHGIPEKRELKAGDIINIDVGVLYKNYYGDCSRMVVVGGKTSPERQLVVDVSYECLMRAIAKLQPGLPISIIGDTIETYATSMGCSVVHQFVAHGVGVEFHEGPQIPHYKNRIGIQLVPGMTFTIEPMINAGVAEAVIDPYDKWTAKTRDGKASAQWEHALLITETGYEILTPWNLESVSTS